MTPEQLDSLLADRAVGELSAEVAALLDWRLERDIVAARRAAAITTALDLTRAAIKRPHETPSPLDVGRLRHAQRTDSALRRRMEILRLAVCLVLGLGLGWLARPARQPGNTTSTIAALAPRRPAPTGTTFWSVEHFVPGTTKPLPK